MTLQQIRDAVDAKLAAVWPTVTAKQAAYFSAHGRYFQGLITHTAIPADGASTAPDNLAATPYYQAETWTAAIGSLGTTLPFAATCDQYDGPSGQGYVVTVYVVVQGVTYARAQQVGGETWRTFGWRATS